jgi:hypothetical protein
MYSTEDRDTRSEEPKNNRRKVDDDETLTTPSLSSAVLSGVLHGVTWVAFALYFPIVLMGRDVVNKIYLNASFLYDPNTSVFDHTIWTYGTDYALAVITAGFAFWIIITSDRSANKTAHRLSRISASMLMLYSISFATAAPCHQFLHSVESRNTTLFRTIWTVCLGTVYFVPAVMGMIGNECLRIFQRRNGCPPLLKSMPRITDTFWVVYASVGTVAYALGRLSFQRPAADIFIAGETQTPCTFYFVAFLYLVDDSKITNGMKFRGLFGFLMNAALLPLYPILVLHDGWSLPEVNTFLHTCLCINWSLQGLTLQQIVKALAEEETHESQKQEGVTGNAEKKLQ